MADYLEDLYTPVASFDETTQAMTKNLSGADPNAPTPQLPIGAGNTMYQGPMFGQQDISNVGGVVGMDNQKKKQEQETLIPEVDEDYFKTDEQLRKEGNKAAGGAALSGAAQGAKLGTKLGSIVPGVGNVAGGIIGGVAGAAFGFFGSKKKQKDKEFEKAWNAA